MGCRTYHHFARGYLSSRGLMSFRLSAEQAAGRDHHRSCRGRTSLNGSQIEQLLLELEARDPASARPLPPTQDSLRMAEESLNAAGIDNVGAHELLDAMDLPAQGVIGLLPEAKAFLQALRASEIRTVVVSKATFRTSAAYKRDFHDLSVGTLMDEVISSVDLGYRKPSDGIFDAALRAAGCLPSEWVAALVIRRIRTLSLRVRKGCAPSWSELSGRRLPASRQTS